MTSSEDSTSRHCPLCGGEMRVTKVTNDRSFFILNDTQTEYKCITCPETVTLASHSTIVVQALSLLLSIGLASVLIIHNYHQLIMGLFKESIGLAAGATAISCTIVFIITGGISNGYKAARSATQAAKHPLLSDNNPFSLVIRFIAAMLYGTIPWVILCGLGFLNDTVMHLPDSLSFIMVILGLSPIFFSDKFGIQGQDAFFATATYPAIGLCIMFFT